MIGEIENGESGLSVRTKLNAAINRLDSIPLLGGEDDPTDDPDAPIALYIQLNGAIWLWLGGPDWMLKA